MEWHDTMEHECICEMYHFKPFYSPWDTEQKELHHCYECNAYNNGKFKQAEISFKAGKTEGYKEGLMMREPYLEGIKEVVEWVGIRLYGSKEKGYKAMNQNPEWQAKLKEWGI
jgi:hypothetical protein